MVDLSDRFRRETTEQLRSLSASLLELERTYSPSDPAWGQRERLGELFRTAHSLKGKFGTEGLDGASDLAHALEDLLDAVAKGRIEPTGSALDDALEAVDALEATVVEAHERGAPETDLTTVRERLRNHVAAAGSESRWADADLGDDDTDLDDLELEPSVREALDSAEEFDDLDRLLDELGDGPDLPEDERGWGVFGDDADATGGDDADATGGDDPRELTDVKTFEELKADLDPAAEDVDDLQADIDATEFGQFDDDDELSIRDLMDADPVGEAPASEVDPGADDDASTARDDLTAFDDIRSEYDPEAEDVDDLQADIDATEFGQFDDDDELSIRDLLDADAAELDPEASFGEGGDEGVEERDSSAGDAEAVDAAGGSDAAGAVDPVADDAETAVDSEDADGVPEATATGDASDADSAEAERVADTAEAERDADDAGRPPDESGVDRATESFEFDWVGDDADDGLADAAGGEAADDADDGLAEADDADAASSETTSAGREAGETGQSGGAESEDGTDGADEPFDLGAEDPFGIEADDSLPGLDDLPDEAEGLDEALAELGEWEGDLPGDFGDVDDAEAALTENFAFGFGQEGSVFDALEYDSLFARYFAPDGVLFGEDPASGAWAAPFIEDTVLDADRFGSLADPDWDGRDGDQRTRGTDPVQSLSVDVDNADRLLGLVERLSEIQRRLERAADGDDVPVADVAADMRPVATDLRHVVMDVRLMPFEAAISGLQRVARDIAREQGKEVTFTVSGADVKLDRGVIERIGDPLVHLVRNAVDHGIEPPDERRHADKPPEGRLELRATRERDAVVVELEDDGRGIDPDAVRQAALEAGLVDEETALNASDEDVYDLLFRPQFSTRDEVTAVSGRGVGLDVVERTVRDLTGEVEVESDVGEGTTVRLTLPVSVAVARVLFVRSGEETYAVPTSVVDTTTLADDARSFEDVAARYGISLDESVTGGAGTTATAASADAGPSLGPAGAPDAADVRGDTDAAGDADAAGDGSEDADEYETVWLSEAFDVDGPVGEERTVVRILGGVRPVEIRCEEASEIQEVVVRPFGDLLGGTPGINGTTTGEGSRVVPVVDVRTL